jgi:hypothetical protein
MTRSPLDTTTDGMFPLLPMPTTSSSRRVQQRQRYPSRVTVELANETITALNHMNRLTSSSRHSSPHHNNNVYARQPLQYSTINRCHARVYDACARFRRQQCGDRQFAFDDSSVFNDLDKFDHNILSHGYSSSAPARMIRAVDVSLPKQAATAELLSVLPPHLRAVYSTPSLLLQRPAVKLVHRKSFMCSSTEYVALLKRMIDRDMIRFTQSPLAVNGLFGVDKDGGDSIRLIIDARPVNSMFVPSPPVSLPTPDLLAQLEIPQGTTLFAAKVDLDNFYHRIRLPAAWWPYFALPPVRAGDLGLAQYAPDSIVWPCCVTLPMGFSHSVFIAQAIHEHIIDVSVPLLQRCDRLVRDVSEPTIDTISVADNPIPLCTSERPAPRGDFAVDRMRHSVYIDDLNLYGTDAATLNAAVDQYITAMSVVHLPAKPSKVVRPTADGLECLGVYVHGRTAEVGMSVPKLQVLRASTLRLLDIGECTGHELSHIIGRWIWAMLLRRPAMAIFSAVYRFIECARSSRYTLWPSVRRELSVAARLAPLLFTSIRSDWAPVIVASDASEFGAGVVFADQPIIPAAVIASIPATPGVLPHPTMTAVVADSRWKTAISHQWRDAEHINGLEVRAALTAVRWSMKRPDVLQPSCTNHRKLILLCDSSATVGAITKGRSSSHRLLRPLRMMSALLLASGIYLKVKWLPSLMNPADGPSRGEENAD